MSLSYPKLRWAFNVSNWKPTYEQWKSAVQCVQPEELERCYRFVFVEDCKSSLVGQLLMRKAATECLGLSYASVVFSRTPSGKPFVEKVEKDHFYFNVSHHGDFCVLGAEKYSNIGIDVMKVEHGRRQSVEDFFTSMKKQFSTYEWDFLVLPGNENEQLRRFYRLWCLKESYVKAIGTGIALDLQRLSFSCPTPALQEKVVTTDTQLYKDGKLQSQWRFEEILLDSDHCVAVAMEPGHEKKTAIDDNQFKNFKFLTFEDLVENSTPFGQAKENFWEDFQAKTEKRKF